MKVQLLSDLHIEFESYIYPDHDSDVVVLAGDIHAKDRGVKWAVQNIPHKPVIYVLGNHEYYGKAYPKLALQLKELAAGTNIHVLEMDVVTIDGGNFLGCALWTNFELFGDPRFAGYQCQQRMNDYKKIKILPGYSKIRSVDTAVAHRQSLQWLEKEFQSRAGQTNVVITHHDPSIVSVPVGLREDITSAAYVSNIDSFIEQYQPDYWLHGHLHNSSDYMIGRCRVMCNPKGYPGEENIQYDPLLSFTV
ncbi:phosphoesterase [Exilibacterium tricleocarpae]|uniref:Phosphoesterase n=1 Tax=Exilibacterium tricleocarpae TaxID=2591008 RepID=A0A545TBC1_9GAMM|nr:metallophosphoesterase [Exilibacterium tricleocarpae]TQV74506.1 phosphoesterase [Exilibacterium tricleocarpae]